MNNNNNNEKTDLIIMIFHIRANDTAKIQAQFPAGNSLNDLMTRLKKIARK